MDQNKKIFSANVVIALVVGLIVGFLFGRYWQKPQIGENGGLTLSEETAESQTAERDLSPLAAVGVLDFSAGQLQVEATDQPAGSRAVVRSASLDRASWLAVREYRGGQLGGIIGARRLPVGVHSNVIVELLAPTGTNQTYAIVIYLDDGDQVFDHRSDQLVKVGEEPLIAAVFQAL